MNLSGSQALVSLVLQRELPSSSFSLVAEEVLSETSILYIYILQCNIGQDNTNNHSLGLGVS